jgi:glycosyltransferase involved in cell wall biosynthesis
MVSVCMSVKNGAPYLDAQVKSIVSQLAPHDELVICDDRSTDDSVKLLESYADPRIRLLCSPSPGIVASFGHALESSRGDIIFLADQDDIWSPNKISSMSRCLEEYDLVVCDCIMIDERQQVQVESFFELNRSGKGFVKNLIRNSYMGCCMAFRRPVLERALPFPRGIAMHDYWIGLVSEMHFRCAFIPEPLVWHRKHGKNHSTTGRESNQPIAKRISQRIQLLKNLVRRTHA